MEQKNFEVTFKGEKIPTFYIKEKQRAFDVIQKLLAYPKATIFGFDTETAAYPKYKDIDKAALSPHLSEIRLIQIYTGKSIVVFDMRFIEDKNIFREFLNTRRFVCHNALFDLQYLMKDYGIKKMDMNCSLIVARCVFQAIYPDEKRARLKELTQTLLGEGILKEAQGTDWSMNDLTFEQIEYAAIDAVCTFKIFEILAKGLIKYDLIKYYKLCKAAQFPIARIQLNGMKLDVDKHLQRVAVWRQELYEAKKELVNLVGFENITSHTIANWLEENLEPHILEHFPRTETGKLSTDAGTLADYAGLPIIKPFSEFQKKKTLTSTFGMSLINQLNPCTNRLHSSYHICGASTGRLSSSKPNLQNAPARDKTFRESFICESGNLLVISDYSQIESRIVGEISQDPTILDIYKNGRDIYKETAQRIYGKSLESINEEERQVSKTLHLGRIYGLGYKKLTKSAKRGGANIDEGQAFGLVQNWCETFSTLFQWQQKQGFESTETLTAKTAFGKIRRLDKDFAYCQGLNVPVQGTAAEIMFLALISIQDWIDENYPEDVKLCNVVHDENILECRSDLDEKVGSAIDECMEKAYLEVFPNGITYKLCTAGSGVNWAEA